MSKIKTEKSNSTKISLGTALVYDKLRAVNVEITLTDKRLSIVGTIGSIQAGQCQDTIKALFPDRAEVQELIAIWDRWHLNDVRAGSPAQSEWLRQNAELVSKFDRMKHYELSCEALAEAGLNPDPNYLVDGKPYQYGHRWLKEEIPAEVIARVRHFMKEGVK